VSEHIEAKKKDHRDLSEKILALGAFIHGNEIFKTLDNLEQVRMIKQLGFMESYLGTLTERIWAAN
jgi:hypothetical protein